ncbi:hypothetical protein [Halorubrum sp. DTA46]|uniref:hypothetical protein n=1 Tax=Halorubrum sp. DTA46 TaxID=3402162 RepID=UPI003AAFFD70
MTRPSEDLSLYGDTADCFRDLKDEIEEARGHEVARARVVEDLILLYRQHGLPYDDPRER